MTESKKIAEQGKPAAKKASEKAGRIEKQSMEMEEKMTAKEKKPKIEKPESIRKLQKMIRKKSHPVFRGRFGKRKFRKVKSKKWDKWRMPRGIDIVKRKEDGMIPKTGYRTSLEIRGRHPSGYYTSLVNNAKELEALSRRKETAAVIAAGVGGRKRKEILKKAGELKILVLNG